MPQVRRMCPSARTTLVPGSAQFEPLEDAAVRQHARPQRAVEDGIDALSGRSEVGASHLRKPRSPFLRRIDLHDNPRPGQRDGKARQWPIGGNTHVPHRAETPMARVGAPDRPRRRVPAEFSAPHPSWGRLHSCSRNWRNTQCQSGCRDMQGHFSQWPLQARLCGRTTGPTMARQTLVGSGKRTATTLVNTSPVSASAMMGGESSSRA